MAEFKLIECVKDSNHIYHHVKKEYIGSTSLKKYDCPAKYKQERDSPTPPTEAMVFGSSMHCLVFEKELFNEEYFTINDDERPVKLNKNGNKADFRDAENKAWRDSLIQKNDNKIYLPWDSVATMNNMNEVIQEHKEALYLLTEGEHKEMSYYTEFDGVKVKIRPDNLYIKKFCTDYKTCEDASVEDFGKHSYSMGYHISCALYTDVLTECYEGFEHPFMFVAQEKKPPYLINIFSPDEAFISIGRYQYKQYLDLHKWCVERNYWPGYEIYGNLERGVSRLSLPAWAFRELPTVNFK